MRQDIQQPGYSYLGVCRISLRYENLLEQQTMQFIEEGWVYAFTISEIHLSEKKLDLFFRVRHTSQIIKLRPAPYFDQERCHQLMQRTKISALETTSILRNRYKFTLYRADVRRINAKVVCEKCGRKLRRVD